jgi:hypothetical protein
MNRKLFMAISACFTVSIAIVISLVGLSDIMKDNRNSFLRLFPSHPIIEAGAFDLKLNSYYIAGGTAHRIYLGNNSRPLHLLSLSTSLTDSQHVKLNVRGILDEKFWAVRVHVDSPDFYLTDGAVPRIFMGTTDTWKAGRYTYDSEYFLDLVPIGSGTFAIKSLSKVSNESILGKITPDSPHFQFNDRLLEKQVDGVFCTDGMMQYDKQLSRLIYLYRYRNEFLVVDTNLNLSLKGNTIDTTRKAKLSVARVASTGATTFSSPPLIVNRGSAVSDKWLFVNSALLASNEHRDVFKEASVIDVYDLLAGDYQFSFYIFHFNGEILKEFQVYGNSLVALFDTHLQVYNLNPAYFPDDRTKNR